MPDLKKYHLHALDHTRLHFEVYDATPYFQKYKDKAAIPHRHSYFQVIWFKTAGRHYIDYEVTDHPANTCFLINKNQVHHFCRDSENEGYLFHFNDIFLAQPEEAFLDRLSLSVFSEMLTHHVVLDQTGAGHMQNATDLILQEMQHKQPNYQDVVFHQFASMLVLLERKVAVHSKGQAGEAFLLTAQFKKLVMAHLDAFWSVDELADRLNTNSKALTRATKTILGNTPGKVVTELKILEAKRMLSNHSMAIKQIGYELGFEQATYFTKYFKKETGVTPREFQQALL